MPVDAIPGLKYKMAFPFGNPDPDLVAAAYFIDTVLEDVFHERHQQHRWKQDACFESLFKLKLRLRQDPDLFQGDIVIQKLYFGFYGHLILDTLIDKVTHDIGKPIDQQGSSGSLHIGFIVNVVERIEEEMRLDLRLEQL